LRACRDVAGSTLDLAVLQSGDDVIAKVVRREGTAEVVVVE